MVCYLIYMLCWMGVWLVIEPQHVTWVKALIVTALLFVAEVARAYQTEAQTEAERESEDPMQTGT